MTSSLDWCEDLDAVAVGEHVLGLDDRLVHGAHPHVLVGHAELIEQLLDRRSRPNLGLDRVADESLDVPLRFAVQLDRDLHLARHSNRGSRRRMMWPWSTSKRG